MNRIGCFVIFILLTCAGVVRAQKSAQFSQYFHSMGYYNPGYAGTSEDLNIFATHRQQWLGGFEVDSKTRAPRSTFAMADMPLRFGQSTHGVGVVFSSETLGASEYMNVAGQYAYKKKLFGGTLSIGAQLGIFNQTTHGEELITPDEDPEQGENGQGNEIDPAIPTTTVEGMSLDMNFGAYYTHKNFYAGFAVMHVMEPEISLGENSAEYVSRVFNLTAGYNIQTRNPLYQVQPSVFLKNETNIFTVDLTARLVYNKMFNGGISWRINDWSKSESVVALLGVSLGRFQVGYAYDFPTTAVQKVSSGSHELMVKYSLKMKKMKTGKNRHKSVRIL